MKQLIFISIIFLLCSCGSGIENKQKQEFDEYEISYINENINDTTIQKQLVFESKGYIYVVKNNEIQKIEKQAVDSSIFGVVLFLLCVFFVIILIAVIFDS